MTTMSLRLACLLFGLSLVQAFDYLPDEYHEWWDPIPPFHPDWMPVLRRSETSANPTVESVHELIVSTLLKARQGIKGGDLVDAVERIAQDVNWILESDRTSLNWEDIRETVVTIAKQLNDLGSLNGDLALLDGLAYLLEHTTELDHIHTTLAAVKLVASTILSEVHNPDITVLYIGIPHPV